MTTDNRARALVTLLDDDDPRIVVRIREELERLGPEVIPILEAACDSPEPRLRARARDALTEITLNQVERTLQDLGTIEDEDYDLETALWALARVEYPGLGMGVVRRTLNEIAGEARPLLAGTASPMEQIRVLNRVFHGRWRFRGVRPDWRNLDAFCINRVLERRRGAAVLLGSIYLLVAWRLRVPVVALGLPNHFLVRLETRRGEIFVDPFERGAIYEDRGPVLQYLHDYMPGELPGDHPSYGKPEEVVYERYVRPLLPREIVVRVVRQMLLSYARVQDRSRERRMERCLDILQNRARTR